MRRQGNLEKPWTVCDGVEQRWWRKSRQLRAGLNGGGVDSVMWHKIEMVVIPIWSGCTAEVHGGRDWGRAVVIAEDGNAGWNGECVTALVARDGVLPDFEIEGAEAMGGTRADLLVRRK
ncbi:hypothetical protein M0R45_036036 [Rubus argutus]|uniref:Uncharacterized protein n=1 Tax=Rubus argutus TaxID=59490 RepID=A0AAW1VUV3_RUBAR